MGIKKRFVDKMRIYIKAGLGGYGLGKYGGIGGQGGNVYLKGVKDFNLKTLLHLSPQKKFIAANGKDSSASSLQGKAGVDLVIKCPLGVSVLTDQHILIGEIEKEGDMLMVAKGGDGGSGVDTRGQKGHHHHINLDFKLIADVGLLGFPNAGKSTLLKAVSRALPKIASYPFTTIEPKIGIMQFADKRQISCADLPGVIEGAHRNVGMGHNFLKHLERTKMILMVVDAMGFRLKPHLPLRSAFENILLLNKELELYKKELLEKPFMLIINKMDIEGTSGKINDLMKDLEDIPKSSRNVREDIKPKTFVKFNNVLQVSAKQHFNTHLLKSRIRSLLDEFCDDEISERDDLVRGMEDKKLKVLKDSMTEHISHNASV